MNKGLIYKITNIVNNKSYIGQTKSIIKNDIEIGLLKRWKEHKNRNACPYFYNAIQKHGINNFKLEILIYCNVFHLDCYEKKYISLYSTNNKLFGYNLTDGGKGVISSSEYIREKISQSRSADHVRTLREPRKINQWLRRHEPWIAIHEHAAAEPLASTQNNSAADRQRPSAKSLTSLNARHDHGEDGVEGAHDNRQCRPTVIAHRTYPTFQPQPTQASKQPRDQRQSPGCDDRLAMKHC